MKKLAIISGVILLLALGTVLYRNIGGHSKSADTLVTLKVGVLIPETGPLAFLGNPMRNSIELAHSNYQEELEKEGLRIDLRWGDSKGKPAETVTALNQMVAMGGVEAVMCLLSGPTKAAYPVAKANELLFVGITVEPSYFSAGDNAVRVYFSFRKEGLALASRVNELGWRNVLLLNSTDAATMYEVNDVLLPELKKLGINVVVDDFAVAQKDFKDLVAKHSQAAVDGVILHGFGTDLIRLQEVISSSAALSKLPKLGSLGCIDIKHDQRALMAGTEFFTPMFAVPDGSTGDFSQVAAAFASKYPGVPFDHSAVYAYDGYAILAQALLRAKSTKASDLRKALSTPVKAMTETYQFNASGDFDPAVILVRFEPDGRITPVKR